MDWIQENHVEIEKDALDHNDWNELGDIHAFLQVFHQISVRQGRENTLDEVLSHMDFLHHHFTRTKNRAFSGPRFYARFHVAWLKFEKYYQLTEQAPVYVAGILLHPALRKTYLSEQWKRNPAWVSNAVKAVRKIWSTEYKSYQLPDEQQEKGQELDEFDRWRQKVYSTASEVKDEFDRFIYGSQVGIGQQTALQWWLEPTQRENFPLLCRMAIDIFCIPPMSTEAERIFSGARRQVRWDRSSMSAKMLEASLPRTLHAANEQLRRLCGSQRDFGGIPIILFCGDFHQFRPVQERSILLPSAAISWDVGNSFKAEQRHQHDQAHALWKKFTTVVMLDEQMRAAGDPELQRLLKRIRLGVQDRTDLDLLNSRCYREGRRISWETGITVVTPLNRNRWNLNMEATLSFQIQQRSMMRIFISERKWMDSLPSEEEATMMLNQGEDSTVPVPGVFMFVPGMPVVVNHNTHQGLKLVNGASYTALDVILDKAPPGHRISADTMVHFGPPAGIILASKATKNFHFVGMPPDTILLTPMSVSIQCQRKRPWQQNDVSRKGLPCTAAFACTDYKVQSRTLERVALELRGTRTTNVDGRVVPSQCDPYSLYVQLSRCRTLDGIMLVSKVRERDLVGNRVPQEMTVAEARLEDRAAVRSIKSD
ncbi:hypothetical protein Forpi1262_v018132 [Fusarium oxysporum f. sp. raphani]|uniref:HAT C-terminal dimerisation domain-containing protein n=1 Tax=Fusarium oxysporum f. sp. raphani TaxID=96318 RepID=A0A8J5NND5_FUSOX|nr:hypothetical protein Forpi1262_v018132 [Fusarium oxysporum f. sp. raphani]